MESSGDVFDCRVSQVYESLPLRDQLVEADGADEFFDVASTPPKAEGVQKEEFFTPLPIPNGPTTAYSLHLSPVAEEPEQEGSSSCERRKSVNDLPQGRVILKAKRRSWQLPKKVVDGVKGDVDRLAKQVFDGIRLEPPTPEKKHPMTTRQDVLVKTPTLSLRNRKVVRMQMKRSRMQSPSTKGPPAKYMGLAEQVFHFFTDTPPRFRRSPRKTIGPENQPKERVKMSITVPHSPALLTKERARTPSPKREETHQIKPLPLNPKVFQPPDMSCKPPPKPSTVPKPFNLTEVHPKKEPLLPVESIELVEFKARPVPKSCRSSISSVSSVSSVPHSDRARRVPTGSTVYETGNSGGIKIKEVNSHLGVTTDLMKNRNIKVEPFSFDLRDRMAKQKKEEKIKMLIEEASKIPKFTARPVPSFINQSSTTSDETMSVSSRKSIFHNHPEEIPTKVPFKAKPATVLTKEPFVPKKIEAPLTDITEFELNTERRARERAQLEQARLEKEKQHKQEMEKYAAEQSKREKEQLRLLRKSMMPKPTPKPSFLSNNASKS